MGGDRNAQIDKDENNKFYSHQLVKYKWVISNRLFTREQVSMSKYYIQRKKKKKERKLWAYIYSNNTQLDYIFIKKKWMNSALNCEVYSSFEEVSSDHRIVTAKIRLGSQK